MISLKKSCWESYIGQKLPFPNYGQIHNYDFFAKINCRHNVAIDYVLNMRNKNIVVISFVVNIWVNTQTNWFVLNMSLFKGIFAQYILKMNYGQISNYDLFPISVASFMAFVILMFFIRSDKNKKNLILLIFIFSANSSAPGTPFGWSVRLTEKSF